MSIAPPAESVHVLTPQLAQAWARATRELETLGDRAGDISAYCVFFGYPRSGHTIIANLLRAHRHAMIAIELDVLRYVDARFDGDRIMALTLERAASGKGLESYEYDYRVPDLDQTGSARPRVIGDKCGGIFNIRYRRRPELLDRLMDAIGIPLLGVHVVRNPFDNITTMLTRGDADYLEQAIDYYFKFVRDSVNIIERMGPRSVLTIRHERFLADPPASLADLCAFVGLDCPGDYAAACASIVNPEPSRTRHAIDWPRFLIDEVHRRIEGAQFLSGYTFED